MLTPGTPAPHFETMNDEGQSVTLESLLNTGPIILFFYPRDFTPVCTQQVCALRDVNEELAALGIRPFGISADESSQHEAFRSRYQLPYSLLCDPGHRIARLYRAAPLFGLLPRRISYLIDDDGLIKDAVSASLRLDPHLAMVDRILGGNASA